MRPLPLGRPVPAASHWPEPLTPQTGCSVGACAIKEWINNSNERGGQALPGLSHGEEGLSLQAQEAQQHSLLGCVQLLHKPLSGHLPDTSSFLGSRRGQVQVGCGCAAGDTFVHLSCLV